MDSGEGKPLFQRANGDPSAKTLKEKLLETSGYVSGLAAAFTLACSLGCAQALGGYVPQFQLNLWRFSVQFLFCLVAVACRKPRVLVERGSIPYLLFVCMSFNVNNVTFYEACLYLPVGTTICLETAILLVLTSSITAILKRQWCRVDLLGAVALVLSGIVFLTQPQFLFGGSGYTIHPLCPRGSASNLSVLDEHEEAVNITDRNLTNTGPTGIAAPADSYAGYIYIFASASGVTATVFCMKIKLQEVDPFVLSMWVGASGVVVSTVAMLIFETPMFPAHITCQLLLMGHAVSVSSCNIFNGFAILVLSPEVFALIHSLPMVFLLSAQYTVMKGVNPGHRNAMEIVGAAEILLGNILGPIYKLCRRKADEDDDTAQDGTRGFELGLQRDVHETAEDED